MRLIAFLFSTLLIFSINVHAAGISTPMTASYLRIACTEASTSDYARGFCDGAIDIGYSSITNWCVPEHVTHGEVKSYVKESLINEQSVNNIPARDFIHNVIDEKWPCK